MHSTPSPATVLSQRSYFPSSPSRATPTTPCLAYEEDLESTPLANPRLRTSSIRPRDQPIGLPRKHVEPMLLASASTATLPTRSSPNADIYSSPCSGSAPELRHPPVDPRRSRRLCRDFDLNEHHAQDDKLATPPLSGFPASYSSHPARASVESIPSSLYDDCSSDVSSYHDVEFDFPQPPPMSPMLRHMRSTPSLVAAESVYELRELLQHRYFSPSKVDLADPLPGYLAPPIQHLSIPKLQPAIALGRPGDLSLCIAASSSSVNILPDDMSPSRSPIAHASHKIQSEIMDTIPDRPLPLTAVSFSSTKPLCEDIPTLKPKTSRRHAMSFASIPDSFPSLNKARLATRKSLSHFKYTTPSISLSSSSSAEDHRSGWNPASIATPRMPQIIRKVASMRSPDNPPKVRRPNTSPGARRPPSSPDLSRDAAAALERLEMSMAKLKAYDSRTSIDLSPRTSPLLSSPVFTRDNPSTRRFTQSQPRPPKDLHASPSVSQSFSDCSSSLLQSHNHNIGSISGSSSSSSSSRFPARPSIPRPKTSPSTSANRRGFYKPPRSAGNPYELKSFMDITPEREEVRNIPKEKMKRLFARASHVIGWGKTKQ